MAKTKAETANNEVIANRLLEQVANDKTLNKDQLREVVFERIVNEFTLSEKEQSDLRANLGNVMKKLIDSGQLNVSDAAKVLPKKEVESFDEPYEKVSEKAKKCIVKYIKAYDVVSRKQIMEDVPAMMGITPEEAKNTASNSKYSWYKSIIGIQLSGLVQNKKVLQPNPDQDLFSILKAPKKTAKKEITRKKESTVEVKKSFLSEPNDKMLANFAEYKKIKVSYEEKQKQEILLALCAGSSSVFEKICVDLVCHFYGVDSSCGTVNGGIDDRGIDGYVIVKDPLGFPPKKLAIQSKCFKDQKKGCTPTLINSFYGAMARKAIRKGFMFTTGVYDQKAINKQFKDALGTSVIVDHYGDEKNYDFGANERMIICIDGKTLVDYMVHYKVGIKFVDGSIAKLDEDYFQKEKK